MATESQIKQYLACWLQVGKRVIHDDGEQDFHPPKILNDSGYSQEFEDWWDDVCQNASHWHLEGCDRALDALFSPHWDIVECPLCVMPVPKLVAGVNDASCTCSDLELWPNLDLPKPHTPEDTHYKLKSLRDKLRLLEGEENLIPKCRDYERNLDLKAV